MDEGSFWKMSQDNNEIYWARILVNFIFIVMIKYSNV